LFGRFAPERSGAEREYKYGVALSHTPDPIDPQPAADEFEEARIRPHFLPSPAVLNEASSSNRASS
jgi:hypothetical protein